MKKFIVGIIMIVCLVAYSGFIPDSNSACAATVELTELAATYIERNEDATDTKVEYTSIDEFVAAAKEMGFSDYEIALCIAEYTGQNTSAMAEDDILSFLNYDNVTMTTSTFFVDEGGNLRNIEDSDVSPLSWVDPENIMQIDIGWSRGITGSDGETNFTVWATATWLDIPNLTVDDDVFVLGVSSSVTYNNAHSAVGRVRQMYTCDACGRANARFRDVNSVNTVDDDLQMSLISGFVPGLKFRITQPDCDYCMGMLINTQCTVYLQYNILTDSSFNLAAGYAHKKLGIGNITPSIDFSGMPSFSADLVVMQEFITFPAETIRLAD